MTGVIDYLSRLLGGMAFWVVVLPWQQGLRVRAGRYLQRLGPGLYLKIPVLDDVQVESVRRRTSTLPVQTLSTADGATITVAAAVGYAIGDLERLYRGLHHAEDTIIQAAQGLIAAEVFRRRKSEMDPADICERLNGQLVQALEPFGLTEVTLQITDFAFVRAFRLIQDQRWSHGRALDTSGSARSGS